MPEEIKNPKYHIGDEIMYSYIGSYGGGVAVCIVKSIWYMDERTGKNEWLYNNGGESIFESQIIKKLN